MKFTMLSLSILNRTPDCPGHQHGSLAMPFSFRASSIIIVIVVLMTLLTGCGNGSGNRQLEHADILIDEVPSFVFASYTIIKETLRSDFIVIVDMNNISVRNAPPYFKFRGGKISKVQRVARISWPGWRDEYIFYCGDEYLNICGIEKPLDYLGKSLDSYDGKSLDLIDALTRAKQPNSHGLYIDGQALPQGCSVIGVNRDALQLAGKTVSVGDSDETALIAINSNVPLVSDGLSRIILERKATDAAKSSP